MPRHVTLPADGDENRLTSSHNLDIGVDGLRAWSDGKRWGAGWAARPALATAVSHFFEVEVTDLDKNIGAVRVGYRCAGAKNDLGSCRRSMSFDSGGRKTWRGKHSKYGTAFVVGDVIGVLLCRHMPAAPGGAVGFFKNGAPLGRAFVLVDLGLGRIVALHHRSSTSYQSLSHIRCLYV
jgi:hypothetical protein